MVLVDIKVKTHHLDTVKKQKLILITHHLFDAKY